MASRENQGLHIALILLVMLTVGLCLTSYVFYSKASTQQSNADKANNDLATARKDLERAGFKVQTLQYMISGGAKTRSGIADDLVNIPGSDGDDPTMAQIRKTFEDNMMLYGAADEEHESARNYESLPTFLLSRIRALNEQLVGLRRSENTLTQQKNQLEQDEAARTKKFADGEQAARNDLTAAQAKFNEDLKKVREQKEEIASQLTEKDDRIVELNAQLEDQRKSYEKQVTALNRTVLDQKLVLKELQQTSFESPDAVITTVNSKEGLVYINVGSGDNLNLQQTFSVFAKGTTGIMQAEPKGSIEVRQILGEHVALCRILTDSISDLMLPGDLVFTPAWSPGRRLHFAVAGFVDITGNDRNDLELLESLINANGGVVDDAVSVHTRYLIQGEDRGDGPEGAATSDEKADFAQKIKAANQIGVDRLDVQKLLSLMGWRADVKTITLGRGTSSSEFKPTEDAKKEESAPDEPAFRKRTPARGSSGAF